LEGHSGRLGSYAASTRSWDRETAQSRAVPIVPVEITEDLAPELLAAELEAHMAPASPAGAGAGDAPVAKGLPPLPDTQTFLHLALPSPKT